MMTHTRLLGDRENKLEEWMDLIDKIPIVVPKRGDEKNKKYNKDHFCRQLAKRATKKAKTSIRSIKALNQYFKNRKLKITLEKKKAFYYLIDHSIGKKHLLVRRITGETVYRKNLKKLSFLSVSYSSSLSSSLSSSSSCSYSPSSSSSSSFDEHFAKDWGKILRKRKTNINERPEMFSPKNKEHSRPIKESQRDQPEIAVLMVDDDCDKVNIIKGNPQTNEDAEEYSFEWNGLLNNASESEKDLVDALGEHIARVNAPLNNKRNDGGINQNRTNINNVTIKRPSQFETSLRGYSLHGHFSKKQTVNNPNVKNDNPKMSEQNSNSKGPISVTYKKS